MNFSVVMIGRNEEKVLPRLAASLVEFQKRGGEVVLVDTGSSDGTAATARAAGFRVEEVGNKFATQLTQKMVIEINKRLSPVDGEVVKQWDRVFDFSEARNYAASLSKTDMVCFIDCDEVFTTLDIDKLEAQVASGVTKIWYDYVNAHNADGHPTAAWQRNHFYDRRYHKWVGIVHEGIFGSAGELEKDFYAPPDMMKIDHYQNRETNRSSYLRGLAVESQNDPGSPRAAHYFGRELYYAGKRHSALKELSRHAAMKNVWTAEQNESMVLCGDICRQFGRDQEAVSWWQRAFDVDSSRRAPLLRLAGYYFDKGDHQRTACYASAALQIKTRCHYADLVTDMEDKPHRYMYWALWYLGRVKEAKVHFDACCWFVPTDPTYIKERALFYPEQQAAA